MARKIPTWQRQRVGMIDAEFRRLAHSIECESAPLVAGLQGIATRLHGIMLDGGKRPLKASYKTLIRLWYSWEAAGRKAPALLPNYSESTNHNHVMPDVLAAEIQRLATGETGGSVTLAVIRAMPKADEAAIDRQINRVYDAMEYPEAHS